MSQTDLSEQVDRSIGATFSNTTKAAGTCSSCGQSSQLGRSAVPTSYVYAIGRIEPRFPRQSIEKEFAQVVARSDTRGLTDRQTQHKILSQRENRYLARQMCWVMTIEGLETYLLVPRDPCDLELLVESLRATPSSLDIDVVIGARGPLAPTEMCNGLAIPIVIVDQIYSFDQQTLLKSIPKPKDVGSDLFKQAASELLERVMQLADNDGAADSHRALNYLAVRYPAIYEKVADAFGANSSLSAVDVSPSRLSAARKITDVIFSFVSRSTDVTEKFFVRVDVTEEFPFLVTKLSPYFDR
jgi:hypothetical protein